MIIGQEKIKELLSLLDQNQKLFCLASSGRRYDIIYYNEVYFLIRGTNLYIRVSRWSDNLRTYEFRIENYRGGSYIYEFEKIIEIVTPEVKKLFLFNIDIFAGANNVWHR